MISESFVALQSLKETGTRGFAFLGLPRIAFVKYEQLQDTVGQI